MKIFILAHQLYRLGFVKESQKAMGLGNVLQTWDFDKDQSTDQEMYDSDDSATYEEDSRTINDTQISNQMGLQNSPRETQQASSEVLWQSAPLPRDHAIIKRLTDYFAKIWPAIKSEPGATISASDATKAAKVFKYFDQSFKDKMDRPGRIAQSGMAIQPAQAMEIVSLATQEFLLSVSDADYQYQYLKELQDWGHGIYQEYADYYYDRVDPSGREQWMADAVKRVDEAPEITDNEFTDLKRRFNEGQRRWEESQGRTWGDQEDVD
jgi:hypothetical protein